MEIVTSAGATYAPDWESIAALNKKLLEVSKAVGYIEKDGKNPHFKYSYQSYEAVAQAVRNALNENGLSFTLAAESLKADGNTRIVTLEGTFTDVDTGAMRMVTWIGEGQDNQDKGTAKAITAAVKYGLMRMLLVSDKENVDPDSSGKIKQHWSQDADLVNQFYAHADKNLELDQQQVDDWLGDFGDYSTGNVALKHLNERLANLKRNMKRLKEEAKEEGGPGSLNRPLSPEMVKKRVLSLVEEILERDPTTAGEPATGLRGGAIGSLGMLFDVPGKRVAQGFKDVARHKILMFFFGRQSSKAMTAAQCHAINRWATDKVNDKYLANEFAVMEAKAIIEGEE